nr:MOB kinase activator 2 isoform X3 [Vicugna pacos]
MLGDHSGLPADRALLSQAPKAGLSCKMVLQAVGKVLRKSKAKPNGKKPAAEEKKVYLEPEYTKSRITDFGFKELVVLPREIDLNEWLASNTTTFFHHVNLQYSTISEFCTGEACQTMAVCNTWATAVPPGAGLPRPCVEGTLPSFWPRWIFPTLASAVRRIQRQAGLGTRWSPWESVAPSSGPQGLV